MKQAVSAVTTQRTDNPLRTEPGHKVVIWSPERFRISRARYGIDEIPQFELVQIGDYSYAANEITDADMTAADRRRGEVDVTPLRRTVIPAYLMADELITQYGARGLVRLDSLVDQDVETLLKVERILLHDAQGPIPFASFGQIVTHLGGLALDGQLKALLRPAIDSILQGVSLAQRHWETFSMDRVGEAERARTTGQGRATFTIQERQMAAMVSLELPSDVLRREEAAQPDLETILADNNERMLNASANLLASVLERVMPTLSPAPAGPASDSAGETAEKSKSGKK